MTFLYSFTITLISGVLWILAFELHNIESILFVLYKVFVITVSYSILKRKVKEFSISSFILGTGLAIITEILLLFLFIAAAFGVFSR